MKKIDFKKVIFVLGIFAVVFVIAGIWSAIILKNGGKVILPWSSESDQKVDLVKVQNDYQNQAKEIVNNYFKQDAEIKDTDFTHKSDNAKLAIDKLLNLVLTKDEKEIQLDLILAFSDAEKGWQTEDQELVDESTKKLEKIMEENEWIR
jgi:predicted transcriptional regulator